MKTIFVYGILQKDRSSKSFDIKDEYYLGRGILNDYVRKSLIAIFKEKGKQVEGDIFRVPDDVEKELNRFESQFGYKRQITKPIRKKDYKEFEAISYLLPQTYKT